MAVHGLQNSEKIFLQSKCFTLNILDMYIPSFPSNVISLNMKYK